MAWNIDYFCLLKNLSRINDQSDDSDSQDSPRTPEEEERDNPEGYVDDSGKHIPKYFYEDR